MEIRKIDDMLEPGEDLQAFLTKCRFDPKVFMNRLVGLEHPVKDFHVEWFNKFLKNKRSVVSAFRGSGKTETLGVLFFLYIAMFMQKKQMLLISKTLPMAKEILQRVRNRIETNELLLNLKPKHHELTWTKTELTTSSGCVLLAKPYSSNIRTWHVDYCFMDEISYYEDKSVFYYTVIPTLQFKDANLMAASTPNSLTDLLAELQKNTDYWRAYYPVVNEKGEPSWPEKFPKGKIEQIKRDIGSSVRFAKEYMLKVVSEETAVIPFEYIEKSCDDNIFLMEAGEEGKRYYFGADFALSATGNYTVLIVLEKVGNKLVVRYMERPQRGTDYKVIEQRIKEIYKAFPFMAGMVDRGSFGRIIEEDLVSDGIPIQGFDFQSRKSGTDGKTELFIRLRSKFVKQNPDIIIPTNIESPYTKKMTDILIKELSEVVPVITKTGFQTYGKAGAYNDAACALALAVWAAGQVTEVDACIEIF